MRAATASIRGRTSRCRRRARWLLVPATVFVLAACGSSSKPAATNTGTQPAATSHAVVMMTNSSMLVDANGMTLYTLTNAGRPVACTGQCATFWPPLLLSSGVATAQGGAGVSGLGVVSMNGGMQVTAHGDPLYRYSGDKAAGETNGEGINTFGGTWHVGHTTAVSGADTNTTAPTPPTTSGGGYGY